MGLDRIYQLISLFLVFLNIFCSFRVVDQAGYPSVFCCTLYSVESYRIVASQTWDIFWDTVRLATVEPARVVLYSPQVLGVAHHAVDGRVTWRDVSDRCCVEVIIWRHDVRRVVMRAVRALAHAHYHWRHVTQSTGLHANKPMAQISHF